MKRLKVLGSITIIAAIFITIAIGALGYKMGKVSKKDMLTLKTIVKAFDKHGLQLKEDNSKSSEDFRLNGIKPVIFSIGDKKDTLLVYTFKSFVEREEIVRGANKFNNSFSLLEYTYNEKNAFIVYRSSQTASTEEDMKSIGETKVLISSMVFKYLNDGKEVIYKGESTSWEGTFTLKYYEHWWQDDKGTFKYESYHEKYPVIKYKMTNKETVGPVNFEYEANASGGSASGLELNKEGYINIGRSEGNGSIPSGRDDINFTIKWGGKEENIVLKAE